MSSKNYDFIFASIDDIQQTIRAVDIKVAALFVVQVLPMSQLDVLTHTLEGFKNCSMAWLIYLLAILIILSWFLSICSSIMAIGFIDNPANHIIQSQNYKGIYYGAPQYQIGLWDIFQNRDEIKANTDVTSYKNLINQYSDDQFFEELVFEQMKLIYIRSMKFIRLGFSIKATLICIFLTIVFSFLPSFFPVT